MSELNLIPYEIKAKTAKIAKIRSYVSYGIIACAALMLIVLIPYLYLGILNMQESDISDKISTNYKVIAEHKKLLSQISDYNMYNNKVELLTKQKVNVHDKIQNLGKYVSKDIYLSSLTYSRDPVTSKDVISFKGVTPVATYTSIGIFAANLQMSKEYPSAKVLNVALSTANTGNLGGKYLFTINIAGDKNK
jgi:hypothetical protein